jgi:hypothetical protein
MLLKRFSQDEANILHHWAIRNVRDTIERANLENVSVEGNNKIGLCEAIERAQTLQRRIEKRILVNTAMILVVW